MADGNPQDRDAWLAKRVGHVTASNLHKVVRRTLKGEPYAYFHDYRAEVMLERLTGRAVDHFTSPAMDRGTLLEPEAALAYEMETGAKLAFSDFVPHPAIEWFGASPDRLVGSDGLLEIKCPGPKNHFDFLMTGIVPVEYYWQVQAQMMCSQRLWTDVMFYNPDMPTHLQSKIVRVEKLDDAAEADTEAKVREFIAGIEADLKRLEPVEVMA